MAIGNGASVEDGLGKARVLIGDRNAQSHPLTIRSGIIATLLPVQHYCGHACDGGHRASIRHRVTRCV